MAAKRDHKNISQSYNQSPKQEVNIQVIRHIRRIVKRDYWLRHACLCALNNMAHTEWIFMKFDECFLKICWENSNFIKIKQE